MVVASCAPRLLLRPSLHCPISSVPTGDQPSRHGGARKGLRLRRVAAGRCVWRPVGHFRDALRRRRRARPSVGHGRPRPALRALLGLLQHLLRRGAMGCVCALCGTGFDDDARLQRTEQCPELNASFVNFEAVMDTQKEKHLRARPTETKCTAAAASSTMGPSACCIGRARASRGTGSTQAGHACSTANGSHTISTLPEMVAVLPRRPPGGIVSLV